MTKIVIKHDDRIGTAALISEYQGNTFRPSATLEAGQSAAIDVNPGDAVKIEYIPSSSPVVEAEALEKEIEEIAEEAAQEAIDEMVEEFDDIDDLVDDVILPKTDKVKGKGMYKR